MRRGVGDQCCVGAGACSCWSIVYVDGLDSDGGMHGDEARRGFTHLALGDGDGVFQVLLWMLGLCN